MIFLQADAIELNDLFRRLEEDVQDQIDNFETHIVPIIADIDGFGNEEATYLLTKKMVEAGHVQSNRKSSIGCKAMWTSGRKSNSASRRLSC
jgi:isocitrate lyase